MEPTGIDPEPEAVTLRPGLCPSSPTGPEHEEHPLHDCTGRGGPEFPRGSQGTAGCVCDYIYIYLHTHM